MGEKVGVVGLGQFGLPIARRIAAAGHAVMAYDILPEARDRAAAHQIGVAASAAELARHCGQIVFSLPASDHVKEACFGPGGIAEGARQGTVVIDTTSGSAEGTREIAARLAERGIDFMDVGVSGGAAGGGTQAVDAGLTLMVGAPPELFARCKPLLEAIGARVFHVGPLGSGHITKMLNNMLLGVSMLATAEAVGAAIKSGIDPKAFVDVLQVSTGRNFCTERRFPDFVLKGDFSPRSGGRLALLEKDMLQALDLGREVGIPMVVGGNAYQMVRMFMAELGPDVPSTEIIRSFEAWGGFTFAR